MSLPRRRAALGALALIAAADVVLLVLTTVGPSPRPAAADPVPVGSVVSGSTIPSLSGTATAQVTTVHAETVAIPSQGVVAPIGVCQIIDGSLEPPADVQRTCQWAGGAALSAATGTSVVTGHVNYTGQGTGALGNIGQLHPGDQVTTTDSDGAPTQWRVVTVLPRPKSTGVDLAAFVGKTGPRQLYLITCGGAFDADEASYVDNIYVRAVPA